MLYNENGHPVESAKQIHSISQPEQEKIEAFLQGCVYTWCNIHEKPPKFCAADFVGLLRTKGLLLRMKDFTPHIIRGTGKLTMMSLNRNVWICPQSAGQYVK